MNINCHVAEACLYKGRSQVQFDWVEDRYTGLGRRATKATLFLDFPPLSVSTSLITVSTLSCGVRYRISVGHQKRMNELMLPKRSLEPRKKVQ